ncbi:unnamed protein product [Chrysoparadoxa australica]
MHMTICQALPTAILRHDLVRCIANLLLQFECVIWAGDLNYRINAPRKVADLLLEKNYHEVLLANEQLTLARKETSAFEGFSEGPLHFRPTYKFDHGCDTYDSGPKQRVPSWTDRVLYSGDFLCLKAYNSVSSLRSSDHRPVYANFEVQVDVSDHEEATLVATNKTTSEVCAIS